MPAALVANHSHGVVQDAGSETTQAVTLILRWRFLRTLGPLASLYLVTRARLGPFTLGDAAYMQQPFPRYIDLDQWTGAYGSSMRRGTP